MTEKKPSKPPTLWSDYHRKVVTIARDLGRRITRNGQEDFIVSRPPTLPPRLVASSLTVLEVTNHIVFQIMSNELYHVWRNLLKHPNSDVDFPLVSFAMNLVSFCFVEIITLCLMDVWCMALQGRRINLGLHPSKDICRRANHRLLDRWIAVASRVLLVLSIRILSFVAVDLALLAQGASAADLLQQHKVDA